ncbi:MAG: hypothetical protein HOO95_00335 [Gallionella sp.]|nr:hypothetical protein [Gallionella sp.]
MNTRTKSFLRGAGSVMDLAAARNLRQLAPRRSGAERMASHFTHVGESVNRACNSFADNGSTPITKIKAA